MLEYFNISTGKLNYHLRLLEGLIEKTAINFYQLTNLGQKTVELLKNFKIQLNVEDQSFIKKAYLSQRDSKVSFLHLMYVTRMK